MRHTERRAGAFGSVPLSDAMKVITVISAVAVFLIVGLLVLGGCVSSERYRKDVLGAYAKGFRVGRRIGRDEVMSVDQMMNMKLDESIDAKRYKELFDEYGLLNSVERSINGKKP